MFVRLWILLEVMMLVVGNWVCKLLSRFKLGFVIILFWVMLVMMKLMVFVFISWLIKVVIGIVDWLS